ncbi:MAG TPA: hypothetical protein VL371_01720, partial [Gemmataceae bacterium]|nr:hypothetical protein [Gemmataceae bacterium]
YVANAEFVSRPEDSDGNFRPVSDQQFPHERQLSSPFAKQPQATFYAAFSNSPMIYVIAIAWLAIRIVYIVQY